MAEYVKITGLKELGVALRALPPELSRTGGPLVKALRKMGRDVQARAKTLVRRKSGTLAENIIVTRTKDPKKYHATQAIEVTVRYKAAKKKDNTKNRRANSVGDFYKNYGPLFYAKFLEFGTSHQPAYPFMIPAFQASQAQLPQIFKAELANEIDKAVSKLYRQRSGQR